MYFYLRTKSDYQRIHSINSRVYYSNTSKKFREREFINSESDACIIKVIVALPKVLRWGPGKTYGR